MAKSYRRVDREQEFLLAPSMLDWLPADHLVWFVIAVIQRLDTAGFHVKAKLGGVGRRGYDPDMLLTLFVYAMAHGVSSSRRIERLCQTDVAFRIICAQDAPDHTVLARFRQAHEEGLTGLLTRSLELAAELGMVSLGVVAFDGVKIAANASLAANRGEGSLRKLAEQFVATVTVTDAEEDARFGEGCRGDELPRSVGDRSHRTERIDRALAQIEARREAAEQAVVEQAAADAQRAEAYLEAIERGRPRRGTPPRGFDPVAVAKARWERERGKVARRAADRAAIDASNPRPRPGRRPVPVDEHCRVRAAKAAYDAAVEKAGSGEGASNPHADASPGGTGGEQERLSANLSDPDSRVLKTRNGWVQGYNCQTSISGDEFLLSARATQDANDLAQFIPTMTEVGDIVAHLAGHTGRSDLAIGTMLGDAGYDSTDNLAATGPDRLIADGTRHHIDTRAATTPVTGDLPQGASCREQMNHRLATTDGHALYTRRAAMIEPSNAWLKDGRGLRRFARRGLSAVQAELSFAAAVTNLLKLFTNGTTAAQIHPG